jgi:phosphoglucosamine mutase
LKIARVCEHDEINGKGDEMADDRSENEKHSSFRCSPFLSLGGESSGHIIDADIFPIGDGTATALAILCAMRDLGESLSSLTSGFSPYPSVSCSITVKNKDSVLLSDTVALAKMRAEELLGNGSRLLLRASGTENKIRILAECPDENKCRSAVRIIESAISSAE